MSEPQNLQQTEVTEDQLIAAAFTNIKARGAFTVFSELRDEAIKAANNLLKAVEEHSHELTEDDRQAAKNLANMGRNKIIALQAAVDAAYKFDQIASSEGFFKN